MAGEAASSEPPRKKGKADRAARGMGEGGEKGPKRKKKGSGKKSGPDGTAPVGAGAAAPAGEKVKVKKAAPPPLPKPPSPAWVKMVIEDFIKFLKSVRAEMKRVTWPSGKEVRVATVVVLITLVVVTGYIAIVNFVLNMIFRLNPTG